MKIFGRRRDKGQSLTDDLVARRNRVGRWAALLVFGVLAIGLAASADRQSLMPGPLSAAHGSLSQCQDCHSGIGEGKFGWLHRVIAPSDPHGDSKSCMSCHKIARDALNPHGVNERRLSERRQTLAKLVKPGDTTLLANARHYLFTAQSATSEGVFCATCHTEHDGRRADMTKVADSRCQACHVIQFDDFEDGHLDYRNYPFRRRTRIQFDHDQHFKTNFPEAVSRKRNTGKVPERCVDCHEPSADRLHMAVKPFSQTCASCHLGQILGKERATGPKGVALLTLPGLDVETLRDKKYALGNWPRDSEAEVSPLMALLIGVDDRRRGLLRIVQGLDLLDLSKASENQLNAVTAFAWEVKKLIHDLITSETSMIKNRIRQATGTKISEERVGRLIAALPRDVLIGTQQEWLPDLSREIADYTKKGGDAAFKFKVPQEKPATKVADWASKTETKKVERAIAQQASSGQAVPGPDSWSISPFGELIKGEADRRRREAERREAEQAEKAAEREEAEQASAKEEAEEPPDKAGSSYATFSEKLDSEAWAALGGWYRRDFAILYRPARHKDQFLRTWLDITSRRSGRKASTQAMLDAAFAHLSNKDAQGQCTKCHSVDDVIRRGGRRPTRLINWAPATHALKAQRFTRFLHEPHFGVVGEKGCLTCHDMAKPAANKPAYKATYKSGDPLMFVSNFQSINKKTCDECHNEASSLQDCTLCHNYHVTKVQSPDMATSIPKAAAAPKK